MLWFILCNGIETTFPLLLLYRKSANWRIDRIFNLGIRAYFIGIGSILVDGSKHRSQGFNTNLIGQNEHEIVIALGFDPFYVDNFYVVAVKNSSGAWSFLVKKFAKIYLGIIIRRLNVYHFVILDAACGINIFIRDE